MYPSAYGRCGSGCRDAIPVAPGAGQLGSFLPKLKDLLPDLFS